MKVCKTADVPNGKGRKFTAGGKELAVFNCDGAFHAIDNTCAHLGGPLSEGIVQGTHVTCPWHDWTYDVTTGKEVYGEGEVACYKTRVEGDDVVAEVSG
ncbi:MAG: Rieske 2Fe-2S domain-containing protein [Deltaproteobacteria bacterium]|nr:Rieske 2Fe-2S domain-containing protein [Deltaproteobacteria bacterium]